MENFGKPNFSKKIESQEKEMDPKIKVRIPTKNDEIKRIRYTLEKIDWLKANGYYPDFIILPEYFQTIAKKLLLKEVTMGEMGYDEINNNLEYSPDDYLETDEYLKQEIVPKIKEVVKVFLKWNSEWGFKVFGEYSILLTKYGTGGSYKINKDAVISHVRMNEGRDYYKTAVHEMVHLGIEDIIVNKFNLSHDEKERVVDLIIKDIIGLPLESIWKEGDGELVKLNEFVTPETISDLPSAIEKYQNNNK
ncbi:MAG TPA: hypothetical protein DIC35_03590 [Candidatus Moranbacteria bacterium]|nr:hypothetical protein [Candidatus Moranbacteria bacterium]